MFQTNVVKKIKTHVSCSVRSFEYRAVYEIIWENIVEGGRPQITVWRMCIARWIPKATIHTLMLCNTHCSSTSTVVAGTRLDATFYIHTFACIFVSVLDQEQI
jgi:hypothetical protein